ncbi:MULTISPECIES: bifunctional glutamate N-acetyltransferase/amino-acid acetyltransferase ArgJ [unclassified Snodgrassella]|uniref:bifunctional glutamate N-acetyltransferase/amino-acid acetyltransferase ArgJ n=1 Tax=unclassified Snodgrassella TaxID=2625236 RepID=UPI0018DB1EDA|nr:MULTISPECIES: bifunctional glutamate N-acetyltransferase/amino-acid acetyltransferase ArgJ [unclassified Snodgrassella]MBI0066971.1 bifunctional glutamate N-acetyltransferase/amino-acid acetyltransferase ArgJ [Snodgrassella sp. M0110]MBI0076110.1 bifunctional glutamate N-acetyltransferase/amino-acid acetyltransferase ArgJ [Snodgrassella sp. M0118]MBI0078272.1 bifunctional glutamate N-acetyltransferase/amino-acid acetyltransferase ArgJ [Snodgrassella sp. M0112]
MAVNLSVPGDEQILAIDGVQVFVGQAGIKKPEHDDLTLIVLNGINSIGAVFTQNRFCAAPVQIAKQHLATDAGVRALVINTGNANAGTGKQGLDDAQLICDKVAQQIGCSASEVLPFSTGVILEPLPVDKIVAALPKVKVVHWPRAAAAIMTTDTVPKMASRTVYIDGHKVRFTGIAKGSGMIHPNMATMLGFVFTDAAIAQPLLQQMVAEVVATSFNAITVDGDTSTNDSFVVVATGKSQLGRIESVAGKDYLAVKTVLADLALELAQAIVRDGEGATKFITIDVRNALTEAEARQVGYAVARSPLVKTAFYASDPNLGRILCAIGYAGIADLDVAAIKVYLGEVLVAENGGRAASYTEEAGQQVMAQNEITVTIDLARAEARAKIYTCDLSREYVTINADYRS